MGWLDNLMGGQPAPSPPGVREAPGRRLYMQAHSQTLCLEAVGEEDEAAVPFTSVSRDTPEPLEEGAGDAALGGESQCSVALPMRLRLKGSVRARPDLVLELVHVSAGCLHEPTPGRRKRKRRREGPGALLEDWGRLVEPAAALTFARLVLPGSMPRVIEGLATAKAAATLVGYTARAAVPPEQMERAERVLRRQQRKAVRALREGLGPRGIGALGGVELSPGGMPDLAGAAAVLVTASALWAVIHPPSYHLVRCMGTLVPVAVGYSRTARDCARGKLAPGHQSERAWRARHKWAAQRVSHLLGDTHEAPPLGGLYDLAEQASLAVGSGSAGRSRSEGSLGWSALSPGQDFSLSVSIPLRAGKRKAPGGNPNTTSSPVSAVEQSSNTATDMQASVAAVREVEGGSGERGAGLLGERGRVREGLAGARGRPPPPAPPGAGVGVELPNSNKLAEGLLTSGLPTISGQAQLDAWSAALASDSLPSEQVQAWEAARAAAANTPVDTSDAGAPGGQASSQRAAPARESRPAGTGGPPPVTEATVEAVMEVDKGADSLAARERAAGVRVYVGDDREGGVIDSSTLTLFGRGDHTAADPDLTLADRADLTARAFYLLAVYFPFLCFGPVLFALAACFQRMAGSSSSQQLTGSYPALEGAPGQASATSSAAATAIGAGSRQGTTRAEAVVDATVLPPADPDTPRGAEQRAAQLRLMAWRLLLMGIRRSGAAFIKWGQWSATREDMFPQELCGILTELHDKAPTHTWPHSQRAIEDAFQRPCEELFAAIDREALASGSVAQVHRAVMLDRQGRPQQVVVKVRHPGVAKRIAQDFRLLKPLAAAAASVPSLKGLSLKESLAQFSQNMTAQADLRVEAVHLDRFYRNFACVRSSVTPPRAIPNLITEGVLVETYEPGESVAKYIRSGDTKSPLNTQIVALGVDTYLKMLLADNFVHTDLHPGNILVRVRNSMAAAAVGASTGGAKPPAGKGAKRSIRAELDAAADAASRADTAKLQLVLLDFGLAEELTPEVRRHFVSFLQSVAAGDPKRATRHLLAFGRDRQDCPDPLALELAVAELFAAECDIHSAAGINLDTVLKSVLQIARIHSVTIDSCYAALVIGVCVLVGFAYALDPEANLMDAAAPALFVHDLTGRIAGRLYS